MKKFMAVLIPVIIILSSCSSQYKTIKRTEFLTKTTKKGEIIKIEEAEYLSSKFTEDRGTNVISLQMTELNGSREPSNYTISPANNDIVFQCYESINDNSFCNLMKLSASSETVSRITSGNYLDIEPCFSKDGSEIFFSSNRNNDTANLFKIKSNGTGGVTRITQSGSHDRYPNCSEESENLVYISKPVNGNEWEIYTVNFGGQLPTQMVKGMFPKYSTDGKKIVFCDIDNRTKKQKIWVMNSDGTGKKQLTFGRDGNDMYPSWSNDNNTIVYCSDYGKDSRGENNFDIWMLTLTEPAKTRKITSNPSADMMPQFSPDGKYIYCLSNRGYSWNIWRLEIVK